MKYEVACRLPDLDKPPCLPVPGVIELIVNRLIGRLLEGALFVEEVWHYG
jgi:hypothetical protein